MLVITVHVLIGIGIFLLVNWLGRHSTAFGYMSLSVFAKADEAPAFNLAFRVLTPVVILVIVSAALYSVNLDWIVSDIWLVSVYYFGVRIVFNGVTERWRLLDWRKITVQFALVVGLTYFAYKYVISERNILLPDLATIGNEIWLAIAAFLYVLANRVTSVDETHKKRKNAYLDSKFDAIRREYQAIVEEVITNEKLEALAYSVMIIEMFNRPTLYRVIERLLFRVGLAKSLGIMQVASDRLISDADSVRLGCELLVHNHREVVRNYDTSRYRERLRYTPPEIMEQTTTLDVLHKTLVMYNFSGDYARDVQELYSIVLHRYYPDSTASLIDEIDYGEHGAA